MTIKNPDQHKKDADKYVKPKEDERHPDEKEIDKTLKDSFPASDPPGHY